MQQKKIIFMGTPAFAVPALQKLILSGHKIVTVYTAPPKPAGRGQEIKKSAVHKIAEEDGLEVRTPASLRSEILPEADFAVVAAYGLLLPKHVLNSPKNGCLNIHPSILPRWRGAAPIQRAIICGDAETGVCIMQMDEGLDTGDILLMQRFPLPDKMDAGELHDLCANLGAEMVLETINNFNNIKVKPQVQDEVTYAKKISKEDEKINWKKPAREIRNLVRGLAPFPAAYFEYEGKKFKVLECEIVDKNGRAGEIEGLTVCCGAGAIKITKIQREGKKPMLAEEFLRGFKFDATL